MGISFHLFFKCFNNLLENAMVKFCVNIILFYQLPMHTYFMISDTGSSYLTRSKKKVNWSEDHQTPQPLEVKVATTNTITST